MHILTRMLLSSMATCVACRKAVPDEEPPPRPNVLFIAIDDLNDWFAPLGGHPQPSTPNFDRLASRGVTFTRAYCNAPVCNGSRASLLSGLRPSTTGTYDNNQPLRAALPEVVTLPQAFQGAGYLVARSGKIFHHRFPDPDSWNESSQSPPDPVPADRPLNEMRVPLVQVPCRGTRPKRSSGA